MANEPKNLYDLQDYFRLTIAGVFKYIEEPIGWDKINIQLKRDPDTYGLNYEFADETVSLIFPDNEGGEEIRAINEIDGSDADVSFEYGYIQNGAYKYQFKGKLNFNDYKESGEGVQITARKDFFGMLLRTRYETKVAMDATEDLDGRPLVPPVPITINLHSKKIKKYGRAEYDSVTFPTGVTLLSTKKAKAYLQPDTSNITKAEVEEMEAMPLSITDNTAQSDQRFQFIAKEAGRVKFTWTINYEISISTLPWSNFFGLPVFDKIGNYSITPAIQVFRNGSLLTSLSPGGAVLSGSTNLTAIGWLLRSFTIEVWFDLVLNDEVYLNDNISTFGNHQRIYHIRNFTGSVEVTQETLAPRSSCVGYKLIDCLNHVVAAITGRTNAVQSSFFGPGGCAEKFFVTNGFQLRKFGKLPQLSLKDLWEGKHPIWNSAFQYSVDGTGQDIILCERLPKLFSGQRILVIDPEDMDFDSWDDEHAKEFTFNEAEFGYTKFSEEELNSLDEFNTFSQWLLPIKTYKDKYEKKSRFIASGYSIESVRREQFKDNPSASLTTDDELFLIAYITERKHLNISFEFSSNSLDLSKPVNLLAGDQFTIVKNGGAGPNDATVFTMIMRDNSGVEKYVVSPAPVADIGNGNLEIILLNPEAEKNESFIQVDNLISPETAYNLRISPARMLYNHSEFLNIGLTKKQGAELIKNTYFKSNGELVTRFIDSAPCKMIDVNAAVKENQSIALSALNGRRKLFEPRRVKFKCKMTYDKLIELKEHLTGQTGTPEDFGFIVITDIDGVKWEVFVWEIDYTPTNEQAELVVMKKNMI
jgi:hypothetical protein